MIAKLLLQNTFFVVAMGALLFGAPLLVGSITTIVSMDSLMCNCTS